MASFLNSQNLLARGTKVSAYRNRQLELQKLFVVNDEKTSAYCNDVEILMSHMNIDYNANDWKLFIDRSKLSLKAVLLHKTNIKPTVPIAYSAYSVASCAIGINDMKVTSIKTIHGRVENLVNLKIQT